MAPPPEIPRALRALVETGSGLLRRSTTGRVLLGRAAGIVDAAALPPELRPLAETLDRAREEASEPLRGRDVERVLREAWDRPPRRVLDELDLDEPVASTPVAQVHRGELDGDPVAVKVLRPGLEAAVRADLALLDALRAPLGAAFPGLDVGGTLRQIRERSLDELDLEHEAQLQRAVGRALRRVDGVEVPAVHTELAAPEVLVAGWLTGPTLAEAEPEDPGAVARTLVAAHVTAARAGLVMTDPRPNHVVLLRGGGIGLLGAGAAVHGDRIRLEGQIGLLAALRDPDPAMAGKRAGALGLLGEDADVPAAHALLREVLGELLDGPATLDAAALDAAGERGLRRLPEAVALAGALTPAPQDIWLGRGSAQLVAVLARLGAREDWVALTSG